MATKFGTTTVADPYEFEMTTYRPGASRQLASGRIFFDATQATNYRRYILRWRQLTTAQLNAIRSGWATTVNTATSITFPDGTVDTCVADPEVPFTQFMYLGANGATRWRVDVSLIEEVPTS